MNEFLILSDEINIKYQYIEKGGGYFHILWLSYNYYRLGVALGIHDHNAYFIDLSGNWKIMTNP